MGAETEGMIGYLIEQELENALGHAMPVATLLTQIRVDPDDPAFETPTKFVGPVYDKATADEMAAIVARNGLPSSVADRCRGWMGADSVGQVAERAVFAVVDDWSMDDVARTVTSAEIGDGWDCTVGVVGRVFDVRVESGRPVPTITCRADGGLPAKLGREYVVTALSER